MPQSPERPLDAPPLPADRRASVDDAPLPPPEQGSAAMAAAARRRDFDAPISSTLPGDMPEDEAEGSLDGGAEGDPQNRDSAPLVSGVGRPRHSREPKHEYVPGEMIAGKYQLSRLLGEGGMGAVWLARNIALDADVAVKLIRRERATPEAAQRLLQEARAAARLGHPSIVRVFDFGESEFKDPFIVMEVLNGESMRDLIERKTRLRPSRAVRMLLPIASALAAAHGKGIIHRDLKPDNILLVTEAGVLVPKIVDFGIAKLHQDSIATPFTQTGQIMGSPGYMSPEQIDGRSDIDHRADVWSFSVVLYEALTGARPFEGSHYSAMLSSILLKEPTPLMELGVGDPALWEIVARGLAKKVNDRWATMAEMGVALARWALANRIETDIAGISLAAHWLHGGDGPKSDGPPSAPYAAYLADDNAISLPPRTPKGANKLPQESIADADTDEGRSTPPPHTAGSPASPPARRQSVSRGSPVLVVDPAPASRRRLVDRPLVLLAIGAFIFGIAGTWITRSLMAPPADSSEAAGGDDRDTLPGSPANPAQGTAAPLTGSTATPSPTPSPTSFANDDPTGAAAAPSGSQAGSKPPGTGSAPGGKKPPGPTGTGKSAKPPPPTMPLPKIPNF